MPTTPTLDRERSLEGDGLVVAGIDEAGRGAWAGPLTVGVVVPGSGPLPDGVRDSKLIPERRREAMYAAVVAWAAAYGVGHASNMECDTLGMSKALRLASARAIESMRLLTPPDILLVDGPHDFPKSGIPAECRVKGDAHHASIAAASIVAKVTRDRIMRSEAEHYPWFAFDRNKGYPSPEHQTALAAWGVTTLHRRSWSYVDRLPWNTRAAEEPVPSHVQLSLL